MKRFLEVHNKINSNCEYHLARETKSITRKQSAQVLSVRLTSTLPAIVQTESGSTNITVTDLHEALPRIPHPRWTDPLRVQVSRH